MNSSLSLLSEEEISRCIPPDEEGSFGSLATPRGHLPLRAMDVQVTLEALLGQVELSQTFVNTFDEPLEATYIFPLPDRAAVTRFRMDVAGRVVEGELQERGQARRTYNQAITAGHRAAIAEEERPGVFTLRVGNVMPGEQARIRLSLSMPLLYDAGEVTFRFPLVVAPRYIPGNPLPGASVGDGVAVDTDVVPDASRISPPVLLPGYPNPVRFSLTVDLLPGHFNPGNFRTSLHSMFVQRDDLGRYHFALQPKERLNRDFILRYEIGAEAVQTSLTLVPDSKDTAQGTFNLTLLPPTKRDYAFRPRDVIFVLDRSGSMSGWKMVAARRALAYMVETLTETDRFNVYAFDDHIETPSHFGGNGLVPATSRNRYRAVQFLQQIDARGGTEMAQPLDTAVKQLASSERDPVLVLLTDGQVGNEDQILKLLGKRLNGIRIFTLGIDQAVNEGFLRRLAGLGGGSCDVVESEARLDEVMYKVHRRIGAPILSNVAVKFAGLEADTALLVPQQKLDLFAGVPLTLTGRYRGEAKGAIEISASDEAGRPWSRTITARVSHHPAAAVLWARGRVRDLEDQFVTGAGNPAALEKQIVQTSLQFGVLCRFTAFVAVDKSEVVNEGGRQHQITQPVEAPAGWEMLRAQAAGTSHYGSQAEATSLLGRLFPSVGRYLGKGITEFKKGVKGLEEDMDADTGVFTGMPTPPAAPLAPESVDDHLCEFTDTAIDFTASDFDAEEMPRASAPFKSPIQPPARRPAVPPPSPGKLRNVAGSRKAPMEKKESRSKAKSAGVFGKLADKLFGRGADRGETESVRRSDHPDLSSYQKRAADMLVRLRAAASADTPGRAQALGVLAVKLGELLEDMQSIGLPHSTLHPLQELLKKLQVLVQQPTPAPAEVLRLWAEAEKALDAFIHGTPVPAT